MTMFMLYIVLTCRIINFSLYNLIMILDEKNMELTGLRMHISYVSVSHLGMLFSWKESSATIQVRPQKLFFCFFSQAPAHSFFLPPLQNFYSKNRALNFVKLNFVFKKIWRKKKCRFPRIRFFKKVPEKQKINSFWPNVLSFI